MKKLGIVIGVIVVILAIFVYIQTRKHPSITIQPQKVRVGYIPIADCAQLYVGIEKGFFKEEGLEIELQSLPGGAKILEALGAGSIDIGFSNVVSLILARARGLKFVALTGGPVEDKNHPEHAILIRKDSTIKSPKDLEGKTLALNTRKNIDELFVSEYLEKNGVDLKKIKFIEIPFENMESALLSGNVDAVATVEPYVSFALSHGESKVLDYNYVILKPRVEISAYVVTEDWLAKNHATATKFIRAFNKATDYALAHEAEVRTIITKYTKLNPTQAQQITLPTWGEKLTLSELEKMVQKVYKRGWIEKPVEASSMVFSP